MEVKKITKLKKKRPLVVAQAGQTLTKRDGDSELLLHKPKKERKHISSLSKEKYAAEPSNQRMTTGAGHPLQDSATAVAEVKHTVVDLGSVHKEHQVTTPAAVKCKAERKRPLPSHITGAPRLGQEVEGHLVVNSPKKAKLDKKVSEPRHCKLLAVSTSQVMTPQHSPAVASPLLSSLRHDNCPLTRGDNKPINPQMQNTELSTTVTAVNDVNDVRPLPSCPPVLLCATHPTTPATLAAAPKMMSAPVAPVASTPIATPSSQPVYISTTTVLPTTPTSIASHPSKVITTAVALSASPSSMVHISQALSPCPPKVCSASSAMGMADSTSVTFPAVVQGTYVSPPQPVTQPYVASAGEHLQHHQDKELLHSRLCSIFPSCPPTLKILRPLGSGHYAKVFEAFDDNAKGNGSELCHRYAVKVIPVTHDWTLDEALRLQQAQKISNVVKCTGCYYQPHLREMWIVMERMDGSLLDLLHAGYEITEEVIADIACQTLQALDGLHMENLVHMDVKPANILYRQSSAAQGRCLGKVQYKLSDFGCTQDQRKKETDELGEYTYMSPEVILRKPRTTLSDIWNLGITLLHIADGEPPLNGWDDNLRVELIANTTMCPQLREPERWSPLFVDFIAKCLVKNYQCRPSAAALLCHPFLTHTIIKDTPCSRTAIATPMAR